jgi:hypothetical protein
MRMRRRPNACAFTPLRRIGDGRRLRGGGFRIGAPEQVAEAEAAPAHGTGRHRGPGRNQALADAAGVSTLRTTNDHDKPAIYRGTSLIKSGSDGAALDSADRPRRPRQYEYSESSIFFVTRPEKSLYTHAW